MEGDPKRAELLLAGLIFQSTPSAWRETLVIIPFNARFTISIHSLRMEGDFPLPCQHPSRRISIHSLRMEGDIVDVVP